MTVALDQATLASLVQLAVALMVAYNTGRSVARDKVMSRVEKTGIETHALSNSAMAAQLKLNVTFATTVWVMAKRMAAMTNEDGDIASAIAAEVRVKEQEEILQEHLLRQAHIDSDAKEK